MYTMQAADAGAVVDVVLSQSERQQLPCRHNAVLPVRQLSDRSIRLAFAGTIPAFCGATGRHRG
jgi:hypothetical protein